MMARPHYVKKARKDNPVAKKGKSYWWWQFAYSPKTYSKTMPRPSQLTRSAFKSEMYSIQEDMAMMSEPADELEDFLNRIDELRDMTQDSLDNMPDQLQEADTGIMLQERIDAMEEWRQELEGLDLDIEDGLSDEARDDRLEAILDDISGVEPMCE